MRSSFRTSSIKLAGKIINGPVLASTWNGRPVYEVVSDRYIQRLSLTHSCKCIINQALRRPQPFLFRLLCCLDIFLANQGKSRVRPVGNTRSKPCIGQDSSSNYNNYRCTLCTACYGEKCVIGCRVVWHCGIIINVWSVIRWRSCGRDLAYEDIIWSLRQNWPLPKIKPPLFAGYAVLSLVFGPSRKRSVSASELPTFKKWGGLIERGEHSTRGQLYPIRSWPKYLSALHGEGILIQ